MECQFLGGAGEVTGSMHVLNTGQDQILMDCGMFQGRRKESNEKNRYFPVDPAKITNMVLSHAHIDHSGRIPMLTQAGFPAGSSPPGPPRMPCLICFWIADISRNPMPSTLITNL